MSKPFCHWPLASAFWNEPNLISPYMPIFMPGTGDGATPKRSPPGRAGGALRSAAGINLGLGSASANAAASRDTGDGDGAASEVFGAGSEALAELERVS